jgi:putative colanic acid biosynthesis acetyltransferase WcaF
VFVTTVKDLIEAKAGFVGPTFSFRSRLRRAVWNIAWFLLARWTPSPFHKLRIALIRAFGGRVSFGAYVYPDVRIWAPWNLYMATHATLGPGVICYDMAPITLGEKAVVSQFVHLCTGTHDYRDPAFRLHAKPIHIGQRAWICASAFVGPGVTIGDGAILGAAGAAFADLQPWTIYGGNPAAVIKARPIIDELHS